MIYTYIYIYIYKFLRIIVILNEIDIYMKNIHMSSILNLNPQILDEC